MNCTSRSSVISSAYVHPHLTEITKIKEGYDMWNDTPSFILVSFCNHYLMSYAALPSNYHLAESSVKDANYCSITGIYERTSSMFATTRSGLDESLNVKANKSRFSRMLKGNLYVSGGVIGGRKIKSDGSDYAEQEYIY